MLMTEARSLPCGSRGAGKVISHIRPWLFWLLAVGSGGFWEFLRRIPHSVGGLEGANWSGKLKMFRKDLQNWHSWS